MDSHGKNKHFFYGNCVLQSINYWQMTFLFFNGLKITYFYFEE